MAVRFIVEVAWQAHFVTNMFIQPSKEELENFKKRKAQFMAKDLVGRDVYLADSGYVLTMAQQDFPKIRFHFTSEFGK